MRKKTEKGVRGWKLPLAETFEDYLGAAENSPVTPLSSKKSGAGRLVGSNRVEPRAVSRPFCR